MTWIDDYSKASFRGKEFWVESSEAQVGRRTVVHLFPLRNTPQVEDLGRFPNRHRLDAFIIGPNYAYELNQLILEFDKPGAGELVHPFWGEMNVVVEGQPTIRESTKHGGCALISITVIQVDEELTTIEENTEEAVHDAVYSCEIAEMDAFEDAWSAADLFGDLVDGLVSALGRVASFLRKVMGYVDAVMAAIDLIVQAIDAVASLIADLILLPKKIAQMIMGAVAAIMGAINKIRSAIADLFGEDANVTVYTGSALLDVETGQPLDMTTATPEEIDAAMAIRDGTDVTETAKIELAMKCFTESKDWGEDEITAPETTPTRILENQSQTALVRLMRVASTIETSRVIATIAFPSWDLALNVRDQLLDNIDILSEEDTCTDTSYAALQDLRAAIVRHMEFTAANLPRVIEYTPIITLPALVIAHDIYGDATKSDDIVDRNNISHPSFVQGGQTLEVLSD
jgi:prophage DNA circulation protein